MTQTELAKRNGVTTQAVSQWETGKAPLKLKHIEKLAGALGVEVVSFFSGGAEPPDTVEQRFIVVIRALGARDRELVFRLIRAAVNFMQKKDNWRPGKLPAAPQRPARRRQ